MIYNIMKIGTHYTTDGGVSDSRFIIKHVDNIIECGLINNNIHKENEHVNIKSFYQLYNLYYYTLIHAFKK